MADECSKASQDLLQERYVNHEQAACFASDRAEALHDLRAPWRTPPFQAMAIALDTRSMT